MAANSRLHARSRPRSDAFRYATFDPAARKTVKPNRWMGECNCLIGPFSCRTVAERFANAMVEFGQFECVRQRVVQHAEAYYVETGGVGEPPVVSS